jgi:pimeloyl-ACP methyl ester carboxylesterase
VCGGRYFVLHYLRFAIPGPRYEWAAELFEAWKTYDWYPVQDEINAFPHYLTEIEAIDIHFLHAKSARKDAIPLLMIHGWPGSFWEFSQVWTRLSNPESDNGKAFHVVVPSMPGFCWSSWPPRSGWTLKDNARIFDKLMGRLGYDKYMVQCGDWGYFVGRELGAQYSDRCKLLHLNFAPSPFPEGIELTEREKAVKARESDWIENHMGYAVCMRSRVSAFIQQRLPTYFVLVSSMLIFLASYNWYCSARQPNWHPHVGWGEIQRSSRP